MRDRAPELRQVPDYLLLNLAESICSSLRAGVPIETVLETGVSSGLSPTAVAASAAGAVVFYCPGADELTPAV